MSATVRPHVPSDRRIAPRRQPALGTMFHFEANAAPEPVLGLVWNISTTGISMLVSDPPRAGTVWSGKLKTITGEHVLAVELRVVHVRKIETGDFLLGAQFVKALEPHDLDAYVI